MVAVQQYSLSLSLSLSASLCLSSVQVTHCVMWPYFVPFGVLGGALVHRR